MASGFLTMGFPAGSDANLRGEFATLLGELAEIDIAVSEAPSYARLAALLAEGATQLAWLSPIPYIALSETVTPLVFNERAKKHYCSAIIVAEDSPIRGLSQLIGKSAAWVDRHSAAGFVVPRIQLASAGIDPRKDLGEQTFAGGHEAVVRAVASGAADFGATFAHKETEAIVGPWSTTEIADRVRVVATFGKIPSDLIVARNDVEMDVRVRVTRALRAMNANDTGRRIVRELFDVERFRMLEPEDYASLQSIARDARDQGLLDEP